MNKKIDYNKALRSSILICSIRVEEMASETLKNMLRIIKPDSKVLGNKSSSLSLKNKIDLLYDLEDLSPIDYAHQIKFMEIRNQFIHNPYCNSFINLKTEASDSAKYLKSKFPNDIEDEEESYSESFKNLFTHSLGKLTILKLEYQKGKSDEIIDYVIAQSVKNLKEVFLISLENWKKSKSKIYVLPWIGISPDDLHSEFLDFERYFNIALIDEQIKIIDSISNAEISEKQIFKKRIDTIAELKKKKESLETK
ncbi:hypothetical protein [Flavobacterium mesophilum]|uniref:hypothetical protein n=1 Tax=Flavobacterium mesophilum TaxID=3143495 RepID=UPI0031CF8D04